VSAKRAPCVVTSAWHAEQVLWDAGLIQCIVSIAVHGMLSESCGTRCLMQQGSCCAFTIIARTHIDSHSIYREHLEV